jgi:Domain of unknown function (DUF4129)
MCRRCTLLVLLQLFLLSIFLCAAAIAEPAPAQLRTGALTVSEYVAELDSLASIARQLAHPEDVRKLLNDIPTVWRIQTAQQTFEVRSEWLRQELNEWQKKPSREIQDRIVARLQILRAEAASFQDSPKDVSQKRVLLNGILAGREFQNIHGPTWLDRFKQRVVELLIKLLSRVFKSSAIPTIGNAVVYGLMALALLAVAYWMYRTIRNNAGVEAIVPLSLSVSSKGWKVWMKEARLAAEGGNWRDAIHLGYWCGISFLEAQELWRPDRARTPREYLRLLPSASEHRQTLGTLTRTFELVWYGTQEADENTFSESLAQLEKLGCQSN